MVIYITAVHNQMQSFIEALNYDELDLEKRKHILHDAIHVTDPTTQKESLHPYIFQTFYEYYNPNITQTGLLTASILFFQKLESLASYVIYADKKDDYITKPQTQKSRDKKQTLFSALDEVPGRKEETIHKAQTTAVSNYTTPPKVITEHDLKTIPGIQPIQDWINALDIKLTTTKQSYLIRKINAMKNEARTDMQILKESHLRPMSFCRLDYHTTEYDFDENTGYYDNEEYHAVSTNTINLSDPHHIKQLLHHYTALRHDHYDNTQSDMRYILDSLDTLIEQSNFKEVFMYLVIRRIDGASFQDISDEIVTKYNLNLSIAYLASTYSKDIPKRIADTHAAIHEDWYYLHVEKADYKKCNGPCQLNKPRTDKYFRKEAKAADGLCSICKECRKRE